VLHAICAYFTNFPRVTQS